MNNQEDPVNYFGELLAVLALEELYRVRVRFRKKDKVQMMNIITDEIEEREAIEHERITAEHNRAKEACSTDRNQ